MDPLILILLLIIILLLGATLFLASKNRAPNQNQEIIQKELTSLRQENQNQINSLRLSLENQLSESRRIQHSSSKELNTRLDNASKVIGDVKKELGLVGTATKRIQEIGQDISSLQDILRSPKLRGNLGEILLEGLLEQMLPGHYQMQYTFRTGERADAILRLKDEKIVAIDSKFPLEDFQRLQAEKDPEAATRLRRTLLTSVKKHIDAISKKYILPAENTLNFAFMYVPAENVYYELTTTDENILAYAWSRHIFVVSPNSFYAYLITVLQGLRALEVEKNVEKILTDLAHLENSLTRFTEDFSKLGTHLRHASGSYESSEKRLDRFTSSLTNLTSSTTTEKSLPTQDAPKT